MFLVKTDSLNLGPTPGNEDCASVGSPEYGVRSHKECQAYIAQLKRMFPIPQNLDGEVWFERRGFPHDMGTYHEVCVVYNTDHAKARSYAWKVESKLPGDWDEQARQELGLT